MLSPVPHPFSRLPWFILKNILSSLPDLFLLHNLYSASPGVAAFLSENNDLFAQIIDVIMARPSRDRGPLPYIQNLVRLVVLVWSPDAHSYAEIPKSIQYVREHSPRPQLPVLKEIPLSTPSAVLFRPLDLIMGLRCVAQKCFHSMIDRCLQLPVEHLPPRDSRTKGKGMRPGRYLSYGEPTDRSQRPKGIPYVPVDIGPPNRLEEQQLLGCLLCVVLFYDLRAEHADSFRIPEIWRHIEVLLTENVEGFWKTFELSNISFGEKLSTLLLWLDEQAGGREQIPSWLRSVVCSREENHCCRHYTLVTDNQEEWGETQPMPRESRGFWRLLDSMISTHSPIRCMDFSIFRPYGLVFWETDRLEALGYPVRGNPMPWWFLNSLRARLVFHVGRRLIYIGVGSPVDIAPLGDHTVFSATWQKANWIVRTLQDCHRFQW
ncbi:hypothetical protein BDW75DRAFT_235482 [Aspergillus navahoensis]